MRGPELRVRDRWRALSPHLDALLEMTEEERVRWIESMKQDDPDQASQLQALLQERAELSREGFLAVGPSLPPSVTLAGQTIGSYTLVSPLGHGGMGTVWLARRSDGQFSGQAALKLLNLELAGPVGAERFKREASILARLTHPHIARMIDAGVSPCGQPYILLEHVDGERIDLYCDRHRLPVEARLRLVLDVLAAVAHAHASLIVHRDIKPSNVLVSANGQVKLVDFGIAKLLEPDDAAAATVLTREGGAAMTPAFATPEQLTGSAITTATDVYGVGVLTYLLLTGRHPTGSGHGSPAELLRATLETEPAHLWDADGAGGEAERLRPAQHADLDTIVAKALRKEPADRYPSAGALADDLRRYLGNEPIRARPHTLAYRAAKFVRRQRLAVGLTAIVLVALLGGLTGITLQARAAARQRDRALEQLERADSINEFTSYLLGQALPGNEPVTMREMLTRGERLVEERFAPNDPVAVDLLVTLGSVYVVREESDNARRILERAYAASRSVADPGVRARAQCAWARATSSQDLAGARRMVDDALRFTSEEPRFDGVVADCLVSQGSLAMDAGDTEGVVRASQQALARLGDRPRAYPETRAGALQMLAIGLMMEGDTAGADRAFARAFEQLRRTGRGQGTDAAVLLHNWARNVAATSPLGALSMNERVMRIFQGQGPDSVPLPSRLNYGIQLNRLARHAEARAVDEAVRDDARRHDNPMLVGLSDIQIAMACRALGDFSCAHVALGEADTVLRSSLPQGHRAFADLGRERGLLAAAEGRPTEALGDLNGAVAIHEADSEKNISAVETLLALVRVELAERRLEDAETHAQAAFALADGFRGRAPYSAWVGLSRIAQGEVQLARGDAPAARRSFEQSLLHLASTLGDAHPALRETRARLATSLP